VHRLFGASLGFTVIALAVWTVRVDPRRWMRMVGIGAFVAVCLQGLLGGSRVTRNSQALAAVHACSGQAVFALLVAIAVWTGPRWWNAAPLGRDEARIRRSGFLTLGLVYLQIVLGAWLRHFPSPLAAGFHGLSALLVIVSACRLIWKVESRRERLSPLVRSARAMGAILALQTALGLAAFWILLPFDGVPGPVSAAQALIRTGHQANGALLLASAVVLSLRAYVGFRSETRSGERVGETAPVSPELEVVC
jgi:cytochrome c oxidase assembly protein subunit 15